MFITISCRKGFVSEAWWLIEFFQEAVRVRPGVLGSWANLVEIWVWSLRDICVTKARLLWYPSHQELGERQWG